jgi:zinc transport system substrate-binding protein
MLERKEKMNARFVVFIGFLLLGLAACGGGEAGNETAGRETEATVNGPIVVYAVNYPLAYFAERIGGSEVDVNFPVPADEDPAYWNPTAEEISAFQLADIVFLNGADYAGWTEKASLPRSKLVNTSASQSDRFIEADESLVHAHGPEGEHEHGTLAFTTWLDLTMAIEQARAIRDALAAQRPEAEARFDAAFAELETDLTELDAELMAAASALEGTAVLGSHPVYQYLASRYGIDLRSVHFEPDEPPSDAGWRELREMQQERAAPLMLWEAEPMTATRERLAREFGISSIVISPCANTPDVDDYMSVMRANAQRLSAIAD